MKKTKKISKTISVEKITEILCNQCGESCSNIKRKKMSSKFFNGEFTGLIEQEIHGGYDSEIIGDMVSWRFSLCEHCLKKLVDGFKIPHEIKESGVNSDFEPLPKYQKSVAKALQLNKEDHIKAILALEPKLSKKELKQQNLTSLNKLYWTLTKNKKSLRKI